MECGRILRSFRIDGALATSAVQSDGDVMKNFKFEITGNELLIRINLTEEHGLSKSGRSIIISSTEGNVPLFDEAGFRDEILNCNVTRKIPKEERGGY